MTLNILQLNAIFNNKDMLTLCEYCGCIYVGDLCECRRIAAINEYYGGDKIGQLYREATMVHTPHRTPRRAVDWFGESYDVSSFAPSSIVEELVEDDIEGVSFYGGTPGEPYIRPAMVQVSRRTPQRALQSATTGAIITSYPSSLEVVEVEETREEEVSHAISNRRNPCTF